MTKQQFIDAVLAEPDVIELIPNTEQIVETKGKYEKGMFEVLFTEPQGGKNFRQVWFIRNTETDETVYQTANTINTAKNTAEAKITALKKYLDNNFLASNILVFTGENWAEVEVYENTNPTITKKKVFVFKQGQQPITHRDLITV